MPKTVFFAFTSLDGYVTDREGNIDWHTPDNEVHAYVNQLEHAYSDHIYDEAGYHVMKWWENPSEFDLENREVREYAALWRRIHKTVISNSISELDPDHYTVRPTLDPDAIRALRSSARGDIQVGSGGLAATLLANNLLDRICLGVVPVILGGGERLNTGTHRRPLTLTESRSFTSGWVFLTYDLHPET